MMRTLLFSALLFWGGVLQAQIFNPPVNGGETSDTTDWRGWSGVSIGFKPWKGVSVVLNQQWRWDGDLSSFDRQLQQLGCSWSPRWNAWSKTQSLGVGLRHTSSPDRKGDVQGVDRFIRLQAEHGASFEAGRWEFETRIRFQKQTAVQLKGGGDPAAEAARKMWRFKCEVGYNIKGFKWDPVFAVERFIPLVPDGWQPDGTWRMRLATGTKVGKRQKIRVFLQRDWEGQYNPAPPGVSLFEVGAGIDDLRRAGAVDWTVGLQWRYRLKLKSKKVNAG
jgi:hypothetical protein